MRLIPTYVRWIAAVIAAVITTVIATTANAALPKPYSASAMHESSRASSFNLRRLETTTTTTSTTTTTTTTTTAPPAPAAPPANLTVTSAATSVDPFTNSWDVPLSNNAVLSDSSTLAANLATQITTVYGSVAVNGGIWNSSASGIASGDGLPIVIVPAGQPMVHISVAPDSSGGGCDNFTSTTTGGGTGSEVPIPPSASALVTGTGDSTFILYQPSTDTEWDFWEADYSASAGWTACDGGELTNLATSSGTFPGAGGFGLAASGISFLGTAITEADVQSGSIDHVIAMDANIGDCNGFIPPATRGDCPSTPGQVSEGSYLRFPASLAMPSGLTPFAQMVFKAVQTYGAVITDQSGGVSIQAENGYDWTYEGHSGTDPITAAWDGKAEYAALGGMPWSQLEVVAP